MAVNGLSCAGPSLSGVPVRISTLLAPDEVLMYLPEMIFGGSMFPMGRRVELVCGFEAYWRLRWAVVDPWWCRFGIELHRRTSARLRK